MVPTTILIDEAPRCVVRPNDTKDLNRFLRNETRFRMVEQQHPEAYAALIAQAQVEAGRRFATYEQLARLDASSGPVPGKE